MKKTVAIAFALSSALISGYVAATDNPPKTENVASEVKLNFSSPSDGNLCVGTLLTNNLVITASHCILDGWAANPQRKLAAQYGNKFSHTAGVYTGSGPAWKKFDPETDLALIRLATPVKAEEGAVPATLVEACRELPVLDGPVTGIEYRRMNDNFDDLPRPQHNTSTIPFVRTGKSALANGKSYISDNGPSGRPGDSGGGVFTPDGVLFGVFNGNSGKHDYVSALCVYADRIRAEGAALGVPF